MTQTTSVNRINLRFSEKRDRLLSIYFTAGFPRLDDTLRILKILEAAGADLVEIGIPFSDPIADGPTIQASNDKALGNGMSLNLLFHQLEGMREAVKIPILLMGYLNPIYQFGVESFGKRCAEVGVDGLIIPDLPLTEYLQDYQSIFASHGLQNIFLISPNTSIQRIKEIDSNSNAFIYVVSSSSTTGAKREISSDQSDYFERINQMGLRNPHLIGFGISNKQTFDRACQYAAGAIIGSAFIDLISNSNNLEKNIQSFISDLKS